MQKIPSRNLQEHARPVSFTIRTMEEIDARNNGRPDRPHRHNYFTVFWSFTATGRHIVDFKEYAIAPGTVFFVSPGQVHQVITDTGPTGIVILFTREFLQHNGIREEFITGLRLFRDCEDSPPLVLPKERAPRIRQLTDEMQRIFQSSDDFKYDALGAYLKLFLIECNNACDLEERHPQTLYTGQHLLKNFKGLVEAHFQKWHKVGDYAAALSVTPGYLNEVVSSLLGQTAKEYIQRRLALEARRLAAYSDLQAQEIGYQIGFDDPSSFSKFFKKMSGRSLAAFRKSV